MATRVDIVEVYAIAPAPKRIELICKNYHNFERIIEGRTAELRFNIIEEQEYNRRQARGDLGIRVQTSGMHSDIVYRQAVSEIEVERAIKDCDFSGGILDGTDHKEEFISDAHTLMRMKREYQLFNSQMAYLDDDEKRQFLCFLKKEKTIDDMADELGVQYHTVVRKMNRFKQIVKGETVRIIESGRR